MTERTIHLIRSYNHDRTVCGKSLLALEHRKRESYRRKDNAHIPPLQPDESLCRGCLVLDNAPSRTEAVCALFASTPEVAIDLAVPADIRAIVGGKVTARWSSLLDGMPDTNDNGPDAIAAKIYAALDEPQKALTVEQYINSLIEDKRHAASISFTASDATLQTPHDLSTASRTQALIADLKTERTFHIVGNAEDSSGICGTPLDPTIQCLQKNVHALTDVQRRFLCTECKARHARDFSERASAIKDFIAYTRGQNIYLDDLTQIELNALADTFATHTNATPGPHPTSPPPSPSREDPHTT